MSGWDAARRRETGGQGDASAAGAENDDDRLTKLRIARARQKAAHARRDKKKDADKKAAGGAHEHAGALEPPAAQKGGNIFAEDAEIGEVPGDDEARLVNPNFEDNLMGGSKGMEARSNADKEGEETGVPEAMKQAHEGNELAAGESPHGFGEEEGSAEGHLGLCLKAAMAPAIAHLIERGEYGQAVKMLAQQFAPSEYIAAIIKVAAKFGTKLSPAAVEVAGKIAVTADVLWEEIQWTWEGFKSIHEAHEGGDRDTRINLYAESFAATFLGGAGAPSQAGLRAATEEEKKAVELGRKDGAASAGATGELAPFIGKELLKRYGNEDNARHAVRDALLRKAGFSGVKGHEG